MAANQLRGPSLLMGWGSTIFTNGAQLSLSAAATWLAMQFVPDQNKTLSKAKIFLQSKTGTPTAVGCTCDLYSDAAGIPNAGTEGPVSADSVPAAGNWMQWTFAGTSALVAGTPYWLVFKNGTATPASNSPNYQFITGVLPAGAVSNLFAPTAVLYGWNKVNTLNSGAAWASSAFGSVAGLRLEYTDGTFDGVPIQTAVRASSGTTADRAFGKSEVGVRFNVPAGATYNIRGVWFPLFKTGSPGALRFRLYQGNTLLGTTYSIPAASVTGTTGDGYTAFFSSPIRVVSTNQPFRVVFGDATAADTNTAGYNSCVYTFENDVNSLALKPMNGTLQKTVTSDNTAGPVVFTDTNTDILPFALLLDTGGEFAASAAARNFGVRTGGRL